MMWMLFWAFVGFAAWVTGGLDATIWAGAGLVIGYIDGRSYDHG